MNNGQPEALGPHGAMLHGPPDVVAVNSAPAPHPCGVPGTGGGGPGAGGPSGPLNGNVRLCAGCGGKIIDRFLLHALDRYWHTACLKCSCCGATLADIGSSCFTKANMILCKTDYIRMFGTTGACNSCGQGIPASEFVMRAQGNVYHLKCFACVKCHNQLMPGDRFNLINGSLFCEQDCHKFLKGSLNAGPARKNAKVGRQESRQKALQKAAAAAAVCHNVDLNQGAFI